jgi:hypothetical protein
MENKMYFTRIKTVRFNDSEVLYDSFYKTMRDLINSDIDNNYVTYDKENDEYKIRYKGRLYTVYYGKEKLNEYRADKETLEFIDKLVKVSEDQKKVRDEDSRRFVYYDKKRTEALRNADSNIFKSDDDKKAKIEMINKEYKDKGHKFFRGIWDLFIGMNVCEKIDLEDKLVYHLILFVIIGIISIVLAFTGSFLAGLTTVLAGGALSLFSCLSALAEPYNGLIGSILSVALLPINILINLILKIIDSVRYKKKLNSVKKTMSKEKKQKLNIRRMNHLFRRINVNEIVKYLDKEAVDDLVKGPIDYENTIKYITELKDKILSIKDKSTSDKLAKELFDIVSYYTDSKLKFDDKKNVLSTLINDLHKKVDDVLSDEKEKEIEKEAYDGCIETVDEQRMINAR